VECIRHDNKQPPGTKTTRDVMMACHKHKEMFLTCLSFLYMTYNLHTNINGKPERSASIATTDRPFLPRVYQYSQGKKWFSWMIQMIFLLWKIWLKINRKKLPQAMCMTWEPSNLSYIKKQGATNKKQ
jgi:hypothetical protein